ncbi:type II secretion system protein GspL [Alkanindiges sp. WGS2144]|uniref:type II secretion system protein GspL n=1 Tax=Alkanindiges sp. WGS2144 TaxID=3366808 RepID=UPI00375161B1
MLYIWMPEGDAAWRWRTNTHDNWHAAANWESLLQDTASENQKEALVFFPTGSSQLLRQPMTRQQLRQLGASGIRYLLEEFSLVPVDQLAVYYQLDTSEHLNIMALPMSLLAQYQNIMALGNWRIQALLPDFLLAPVPLELHEAQLVIHQQQRVLRVGEYVAYCADDLTVLLDYLPELEQLHIWGDITEQDQLAINGIAGLQTILHDWTQAPLPLSDAQYIRHPFNALPKTRHVLSGYWRAIAAVFVAALLVQMLYDGVRFWRYNQVANQTSAMATQQFQSWFPEERRIINLRKQFEGHLQSNNSTDLTALTLMSRVGPLLQQANLPASQVQYRDNVLELTILASGMPALEALRSQLDSQGLKAELGSVNPVSGQVSGLIRVQL